MNLYRPSYRDKTTGDRKQQAVWWFQFVFAGKKIQASSGTTDKTVALQAGRDHMARIAEAARSGEFQSEFNRKVLIGSNVCLYREKAPFVPSGLSISGALEFDEANQTVRCHECGEWFAHLGVHVARAHELTSVEYKRKHGLNHGAALVSEAVRSRLVLSQAGRVCHLVPFRRGHSGYARKGSRGLYMQARNLKGVCPAQILERIKSLSEELGRTPGTLDLAKKGIHARSVRHLFGCGLPEVCRLAGLSAASRIGRPPGAAKVHKYSRTILVEMLRDFKVRFDRLASFSDFRRGLLPSRSAYIKAFGSMANAFFAAGFDAPRVGRPRRSQAGI